MEKGIRVRPRGFSLHVRPTHQAHCRLQRQLAMGSLTWPKKPEAIGRGTISRWSESAVIDASVTGAPARPCVAIGQSLARAPRVFWLMNWSFAVLSLLRFVVGRTCRASEVLRFDLLDIELRYALAHCFQNILERWRFALDPSQRIDARDHE